MKTNNKNIIYDLIGVGVGPFNLGLAALAHTTPNVSSMFFEKNEQFSWHPGLLLDGSTLQVPFMADLVTLADPTHPLSFLQYLLQKKRIYKFYFLENFHITRQEYNDYCQWASAKLASLNYSHEVTKVERVETNDDSLLRLTTTDLTTNVDKSFLTRHIALGMGTLPYIPENLRKIKSDYIQHSANFLNFSDKLANSVNTICVVGSGQSAAEIVLELLNKDTIHSQPVIWATRSPGFFPMEYTKFGLEHFTPDYMQHFYHLSSQTKKDLIAQQTLMYKGINHKTISDIFNRLYQLTIAGRSQPLTLLSHTDLLSINEQSANAAFRFNLQFNHLQVDKLFTIDCDAVILATGYQAPQPKILAALQEDLVVDENQAYALNKDFSIKTKTDIKNKIFVQNNSLNSHGVGSADLGLGCYRNSVILNTITRTDLYPVDDGNVFQSFNLPKCG